jgi:hypothetical protein
MPYVPTSGIPPSRSDRIREFLDRHSAATRQIARLFFASGAVDEETARKKASRWLVKERKRGLVEVVGWLNLRSTGRPELVFGRRCRPEEIAHEVGVAEVQLAFPDSLFERGEATGATEADAMFVHDGERMYLEIDWSQNMSRKQMTAKWERYAGVAGTILVVTRTEARLETLRHNAGAVTDRALFTTFARLASGLEEPWTDACGKTTGL